jgi:predicted aconitase with swiveling domain
VAAPQIYTRNFGSGNAASVVVDLGQQAAAGHSIVICICDSLIDTAALPAGMSLDLTATVANYFRWFHLAETDGTEQTFTFPNIAASVKNYLWAVWETDRLDYYGGLDASAAAVTQNTAVTTQTTGTTATTGTVDTLNFALHLFVFGGSGAYGGTGSWDSHTGGFVEDAERDIAVSASYIVGSFSVLDGTGLSGPFESTATLSTTVARNSSTDTLYGGIVSYRAPAYDTPWNQNQTVMVG